MGGPLWGSDGWLADQNQQTLTTITTLHKQVARAKRNRNQTEALALAIQAGQKLRDLVQGEQIAS